MFYKGSVNLWLICVFYRKKRRLVVYLKTCQKFQSSISLHSIGKREANVCIKNEIDLALDMQKVHEQIKWKL